MLAPQIPVPGSPTQPPALASIPAFAAMRSTSAALVAGFDSEFGVMADGSGRYISSYQFAVPVPGSPWPRQLVLAPFQVDPRARLTIEGAMEVLVRLGGLTAHELCRYNESGEPHELGRVWAGHDSAGNEHTGSFEDAVNKAATAAERNGLLRSRYTRPGGQVEYVRQTTNNWQEGKGLGWRWGRRPMMTRALPLTLLGHYGSAYMGTFWYDGEPCRVDFLRKLMSVGGGKVITGEYPVDVLPRNTQAGSSRRRYHPVRMVVRDTKALAPAGFGSLEALGDLVGQPKVEITKEELTDMAAFSRADTARWLEYGAGDPLVCLEYTTAFFGDGKKVPHTLASASARAVREVVIDKLRILPSPDRTRTEQLKAIFAGERPLEERIEATEDGMGFRTVEGWTSLDGDAVVFQNASANAFRGGLNQCTEVGGVVGSVTCDFDLKGAYLAAAAMVRDVDLLHDDGVVEETVSKRMLTSTMCPSGRRRSWATSVGSSLST